MHSDSSRSDRARGVLLGLACGDALGAPVEFESRAQIAAKYPDGLRDFTSGGWLNVEPGELTDDSRMALDLAEILAIPGPVRMDELARRFVAWVDEVPKDVGNTTKLAISHLKSGLDWSLAGQRALDAFGPGSAASNGSIMRTAPVAIRFWNDLATLHTVSLDTSRITHAEPRCQWACVALNQGIAHLLNDGDPATLISAAIANISLASVVESIRGTATMDSSALSGTGYVLNALQIAFWAVQNHNSFEDAVVAAVMIGDDTDTNAAVTGALAGALFGKTAIPDRWLAILHSRDRLESLADQLLACSSDSA